MPKFNKYYTLPLHMWNNFTIKVFTKDNNMAFDWIANISNDIKSEVLKKLNTPNCKTSLKPGGYTHKDGRILKDGYPIILIRGWGMLTGTGGFNLPSHKAIKIQDEFTEYIVNTLNN